MQERVSKVSVFLTVGFFPHDEPTVNPNCELPVATRWLPTSAAAIVLLNYLMTQWRDEPPAWETVILREAKNRRICRKNAETLLPQSGIRVTAWDPSWSRPHLL